MDNRKATGTRGGWLKFGGNPVLGGELGTCFDISVLLQDGIYKMYFSWRPRQSIAMTESRDGMSWSEPRICLGPRASAEGWEDELNRPAVVFHDGLYHMWYTGQFKPGIADGTSHIFHAVSQDGVCFERTGTQPVLRPEQSWEKSAVMCPDVMWDQEEQQYKMWYSAGEQYEPNAIGYAVSRDGIHWDKEAGNPVFAAAAEQSWEQHKAAACHMVKTAEGYMMFYIGYHDEHYAQIGMARSQNGIDRWERSLMNPIIAPDPGTWDGEACYKPYAIYDGEKWMLWYNGRNGRPEQVGLAVHWGYDLGFI